MNTSELKRYAIQARRDFRDAVGARAKRVGVTDSEIEKYSIQGDLLIIGEQTFSKEYKSAFDSLYREVTSKGFERVIDDLAYTWFNRFVALRFMELRDYFPHGLRVLSSQDADPTPHILRNPLQLDFSYGFNKKLAQELFEAGNREEELYRLLLIAQCNELNTVMPFLFDRVSDLSELLLPDNLLASDSVIRKLVSEIEEDQWQKGVEIVGWIYQYYISEKKDEVMGKVVKSEDIPAATQLFTPNWIVKYLVQNSVGAYWLGTYPESALRSKMEYYIAPAEQEPEVLQEIAKITPSEINPESITVLDPASGSGHILVEAYDILKEIYLERGYRPREIPRLILEKNLFGLDIDTRAAQLASFALLMKARADDQSIFSSDHPVKLNIIEIIEADFSVDEAVQSLTKGKSVTIEQIEMPFMPQPAQAQLKLSAPGTLSASELKEFIELFKDAKTFGSLITIPAEMLGKVGGITSLAEKASQSGDIFERMYGLKVLRLCVQAKVLGGQFDAVVANPPYMGGKYLNPALKNFLKQHFAGYEKDLFSAFIAHCFSLTKQGGRLGFMSPFVWMFISSYEELRALLINNYLISSLIQLEYSGFDGATVPICTFVLQKLEVSSYRGSYIKLSDFRGAENQAPKTLEAIRNRECGWFFSCKQSDFNAIPGAPIAYWVSDRMRQIFKEGTPLSTLFPIKQGMATSDNNRFLRNWFEVSNSNINFSCSSLEESESGGERWYPYLKGGDFRKWAGNEQFVVNWHRNGAELKAFQSTLNQGWHVRLKSREYYFKPSVTWTFISSSLFGVRKAEAGFIFDVAGSCIFPSEDELNYWTAFLCSKIAVLFLKALNPTLNFQIENVAALPVIYGSHREKTLSRIKSIADECISISRLDWDAEETSWRFNSTPILSRSLKLSSLESTYNSYESNCLALHSRLQELETENNRLFFQVYALESELSPEVPESEITLHRPDRLKDICIFLSYYTGCTLGRYTLDTPGLVYANSGNIDFDPTRYKKFPADADGVVPILDQPWFNDDITTRFKEFLLACWNSDTFNENIKFVADSLNPKAGETPEETIRRYFCDDFYKNHLKMYKKRPIYWLFSSGKEKAFQALVYLHRYNEQTLSKMRTDYVLPLQGKMSNEEKRLDAQVLAASSPAEGNRYKKDLEKLRKKQVELRKFDELLHHYADKRISLDLDDGVKANYGKFGALLSEVKQVTGGSED